jgi:hypothetical protein
MNPDGSHELSFLPAFIVPQETASDGQARIWVGTFLAEIERQVQLDPANSNDYLFWSDRDDPAYAKHRLNDSSDPLVPTGRVA